MDIASLLAKNLPAELLPDPKVTHWGKRLFFSICVLIFIGVQFSQSLLPILRRTVPVEADDAYSYIVKASEMSSCFMQDCPALNSLRGQLTDPAENPETSWLRYREYDRVFLIYHPLHSLILAGLHRIGLSWEMAYYGLVLAGSLGIGLAIIFWLYSMFGLGPASIALLLLAFRLFPGQGISFIVPSNLALGFAMLTWAFMLRHDTDSHWALLIGSLLMTWMHPIGRIYALLTVILYLFIARQRLTRKTWFFGILSFALILIPFLLPFVVKSPEFAVTADPAPAGFQPWQGYTNNFDSASIIATAWFNLSGGFLIAIILVSAGMLSLPAGRQRSNILALGFLLMGLVLASLFIVLPHYPAETFSRVWIPFAILLTGLIAHSIWQLLKLLFVEVRRAAREGWSGYVNKASLLSLRGWVFVLLLVFGSFFGLNTYTRAVSGLRTISYKINTGINIQNVVFEPLQTQLLPAKNCGDVLYLSEVPFYYYLTYGTWRCGAIYYPAVAGTPLESQWIGENPDLKFLVNWNPTFTTTIMGGGNPLTLRSGDRLDFQLKDSGQGKPVSVFLENPGAAVTLNIFALAANQSAATSMTGTLSLPSGWSGWELIEPSTSGLQSGFSLGVVNNEDRLILRGIRLDPGSKFKWPWNQGLNLVYTDLTPGAAVRTISFDTQKLPETPGLSWSVVNDDGDTVLMKLKK